MNIKEEPLEVTEALVTNSESWSFFEVSSRCREVQYSTDFIADIWGREKGLMRLWEGAVVKLP